MNPELTAGDRIVLYYMDDSYGVNPGTKGTVTSVVPDPFDPEDKIINVAWDNGSSLSLIASIDKWKLEKKKIKEGVDSDSDPQVHFLVKNKDVKKSFDLNYFLEYFKTLRDSGITNMYGSSPFVYMTSEHLDRYYGEGREDDENFQKLMEIQDDARRKFLEGLTKYMEKTNVEFDDDKINSTARKLASSLLQFYILFLR